MDASERRSTTVIAVGNQKGGVGKTTNTVQLVAGLAERGRRCLIFDLDMNHGATHHFGVEPSAFLGTFEVLAGIEAPLDVVLRRGDPDLDVELPEGIDLIPANRKLESIDEKLKECNKFIVPIEALEKPLAQLRGHYDYIFLDTAPNATTPTLAAYRSADYFILSAQPESFAIRGLQDALQDIADAQAGVNPKLTLLGVVLSCIDKRTRLSNELTQYVEDEFAAGGDLRGKFHTMISRSTVVPRAQKVGKTLFETEPTHQVTQQYRQLAAEVESRLAARRTPAHVEPKPVAAVGEVSIHG